MLPTRRLLLGAGLALPAAARAQAWPTRPIVMVAPLAAGGTTDTVSRLLAEQWTQRLGQPVTVDNRPAANGTLALGQVARAAPDGYTTVMGGQSFNPYLYPHLPYDPLRDFTYVTRVAGVSNALVVRAASPFRSVAELVAAARENPGKLTYSSGGIGTSHHISAAMLEQQADIRMTHVPYRGASPAILAAMTGEVDFGSYNISTLLPSIRSGDLRALAVTSAQRSPFLPEVPTMKEQGYPDYEMTAWVGVATPAGVPEPIIARMYEVTRAALDDPAVQRRLTELGFERLAPLTPAEMPAFLRAEDARWGPIVRATGARLE